MNFSTVPPCASMIPLHDREVAVHERPQRLRIELLAERGRTSDVGEQDRDELARRRGRATSRATSAAPHSGQNLAPAGFSVPQVGHGIMRGRVSDREGEVTAGVASRRARGHHRCPVFDTIPVTRGLVTAPPPPPTLWPAPSINRANSEKERVDEHEAPSRRIRRLGEDDTEGQSFKARGAVPDEDDTEGQSLQGARGARPTRTTPRASASRHTRCAPDEDDTEGQRFKAHAVRPPTRTTPRASASSATRCAATRTTPRASASRRTAVDADEDDTEGQSLQAPPRPATRTTPRASRFKRHAVDRDEDDTEGQRFNAVLTDLAFQNGRDDDPA